MQLKKLNKSVEYKISTNDQLKIFQPKSLKKYFIR